MKKAKTDQKKFWCKKRKTLVNRYTLGCQDKDCFKDCPDKPTLELTPKQKLKKARVNIDWVFVFYKNYTILHGELIERLKEKHQDLRPVYQEITKKTRTLTERHTVMLGLLRCLAVYNESIFKPRELKRQLEELRLEIIRLTNKLIEKLDKYQKLEEEGIISSNTIFETNYLLNKAVRTRALTEVKDIIKRLQQFDSRDILEAFALESEYSQIEPKTVVDKKDLIKKLLQYDSRDIPTLCDLLEAFAGELAFSQIEPITAVDKKVLASQKPSVADFIRCFYGTIEESKQCASLPIGFNLSYKAIADIADCLLDKNDKKDFITEDDVKNALRPFKNQSI